VTRVLTLFALLAALAMPAGAFAAAQARTSLPDVEDEVMCVSCKVPLYIAESPQADRERAFIERLVDQGLTKDQIKDQMVEQYGKNVLAMPDEGGVGIAAYVVPIAVVLALLAGVAVLVPRWRRRSRVITGPPPPEASDEELERVDEELQRVG
jgi:cytochrome c-type biogenesis protein CcmH